MNRYQDPFDDTFPDPDQYNEYLDGLSAERIKQINTDLRMMFEADQRQTQAGLAFCGAAEQFFDALSRILKEDSEN